MAESQLLDIPAGQSILPALARKEHELQEKIAKAAKEAEARVEEARKAAAQRVREDRAKIPEEENAFLEKELEGARERAKKIESQGMAEIARMREHLKAKIEPAAETVVDLVLGRETE